MTLPHVNWLAVFVASLSSFALGGLWFGPKTFFPVWWKAMGRDPDAKPGEGMNMGVVFGSTYAAALVQVVATAVAVGLASQGAASFGAADGALVGFVFGCGFSAAASLSHRLFAGHGFKVWILEVASDVLNVTVAGAILGAWR